MSKKLFEINPEEMGLEVLLRFQPALIAKLILINNEIISRYEALGEAAANLKNRGDDYKIFQEHKQKIKGFNKMLHDQLDNEIHGGKIERL